MTRNAIMIALLVPLLAGCATSTNSGTPSAEPPMGGAPSGNEPHVQFATDWLNSTTSGIQAGTGPIGFAGSNCARFESGNLQRVELGWANVSWTSPNPLADVMRLTVMHDENPIELEGPSPLSLELRDVAPDAVHGLLISLRTTTTVGADVEVDLNLNWTFHYLGNPSLDHAEWTCD